jgi:alpha-glucoside transport system permease protein
MPSAPRSLQPSAFKAGALADLGDGVTLLVNADGSYRYMKIAAFGPDDARPARLLSPSPRPPASPCDNYRRF